MKKLLVATTALALMAATGAFAQDEHHGEHGGGPPPARAQAPAPQAQRAAPAPQASRPENPGVRVQGGGYQPGAQQAYRPQGQQNYRPDQGGRAQGIETYHAQGQQNYRSDQGGEAYRQGEQANRPDHGGRPQNAEAYRQGGEGDRSGRQFAGHGPREGWGAPGFVPGGRDRPRYNGQYYPREMRLDHAYHWVGGGWRPQPGFYYRRWGYGDYLPFGWFAQPYWVSDYWDYDLPVPPYGYQWVRSGPDVLLINLANGFVVETVYGAFD